MLIVMHHTATRKDVARIKEAIKALGLTSAALPGAERTAIGVLGNKSRVDDSALQGLPGILEIIHVTKPYKLVSRDFHPRDTVVRMGAGGKRRIGGAGSPLFVIAGPCAIESLEQMMKTALYLKKLGVPALRGGAYKPRTSVHSFQGMREEGVRILEEVRRKTGLITVTEVMAPEQASLVARSVDVIQIGARNMQNFDLLREVGKYKNPVILKRGLSATVEEWLASAEYILVGGNPNVIMCERGIRTFETATRNTSDLAAIPLVKGMSHLPVIYDPSHATGVRALVGPMALASVMAGADGVMVEVHPEPDKATSDGRQSLDFKDFKVLAGRMKATAEFAKKLK